MVDKLHDVLREARSEIIGGLVVLAVGTFITIIIAGRGLKVASLATLPIIVILLLVLWVFTRLEGTKPPHPVPKPEKLPVPKFIRRRDEQGHDLVKEVSEALKKAALVVIWGTGGVGKTTLAKEVAARLFESRYKGGVIWADADDVTGFGFISLLDKILDKLERQDARTLALDPKKRLVTSLLGEEDSRLIVVDNFEAIAAEERKRIVPFLCALPCAALVPSRRRIDQAENIHLPPMSDQEALDFLKMAVRNTKFASKLSESQLNKIALTADRNPLYMQWVVGQVERARALDETLADIKAGERETAERIFDRSYKLLSPDGQSALLALALFVPSASRQALGFVAGFGQPGNWFQRLISRLRLGKTPAARLQLALGELATLALLEPRDNRLGLLRLTRELALTRLEKERHGKELRERFILYFLAYAEAHPEVTKEDLDALEAERENFLAAMHYAYKAEQSQSLIAILGTIAFPGLLYTRGYWDDALTWGERGLEAARKAHDEVTIAWVAHNVANIYESRGKYDEAKNLYNQSLEIFRNLGDQAGIASSLHQLGIIAQDQGHYQEAKDLYNQSLEIKRNLGDQAGIAKSLHQLGTIAQDQGNYQEAKDLYNQSLEIKRNLGDQAGIAKSLHQLGNIALLQGDYQEAKDLYNQSLETFKDLGAKSEQATVLHQLGTIAQPQGHYQEAKDLYNQSLEIARNLGDQAGIASSLFQLGRVAEDEGKAEEAIRLFKESLVLAEKLGVPEAEMVRRALARVTGEEPKE